MDLILSLRPSVPGRRSSSCVCSKVTFLYGMVVFTTVLTGSVDRSMFLDFLIVCIDGIGFVGNLFVRVRVCLTTVIVVVIAGTFLVVMGLVFLPFELKTLISIVTWHFAMVASGFGFFWVLLCGLLRHEKFLQLIWSFQSIQFELIFKMWHNLLLYALLQMRLINQFLQVGRAFGTNELFNDQLSGNSQCIFH